MLLLARRAGDAVLLDGGIRITVVAVEGKTVRLGIEAPPDITILRAEIADDLARENLGAVPSRDLAQRLGLVPPPAPGGTPPAAATEATADQPPPAPRRGGKGGTRSK